MFKLISLNIVDFNKKLKINIIKRVMKRVMKKKKNQMSN